MSLGSPAKGSEKRRTELARMAFDLIAEKGFEGLRVRDVAERAGVNIATLHYYFPTKEELVRAVVDHLQRLFASMNASRKVGGETTAIEQLRREVTSLETHMRERPEIFAVLVETGVRSHRDKSIREILTRMEYGWRSYLAAIVMRGQRDGSIRADLNPFTAASFLASLIKGMSNQYICGLDKPDLGSIADEVGRWAGAGD